MEHPDARNDISIKDYIASIGDEQMVEDTQVLIEMMQRMKKLSSVVQLKCYCVVEL